MMSNRMKAIRQLACLTILTIATMPFPANAAVEERGGRIEATVDGKTISFPTLRVDISANVQGDLASVTVIQTFANPTASPLNATYLFPLNKDGAVTAMQMHVGDEIVQAKIEKREEARQTFETAKRSGKAAALLEQHRPNMFTQDIANLMPGMPIKVTLTYVQTVPRIDGRYELVVPLVVGPRYIPNPRHAPPAAAVVFDGTSRVDAPEDRQSPRTPGQWSFSPAPEYPHVAGLSTPETIENDRVGIIVALTSGTAIASVTSPTHTLAVTDNEASKSVALQKGRTIDNKDFVLRYELAGDKTQTGFLAHRDDRGGFFSLMIEPPSVPEAKDVMPRELVFVLDTSGSMNGEPMAASKTFMRHALQAMRPTDYFRVIRFSNNASEFTAGPVPATQANKAAGLAYVRSLQAGGGTEIPNAIQQAFAIPPARGTMRIVVFLSDGYIGNEADVLNLISANIGQARIYAFGVGTSVNRFLLAEMARKGRGFVRYIDPTETSNDAAIDLANRLKSPLLTDIEIDWGDAEPTKITPASIPDLFAGDSIRIQGRFRAKGTQTILVKGRVNGKVATLPLTVALPETSTEGATSALPAIWARSQIADHMRELTSPAQLRSSGASDAALQNAVTKLGLEHSLVTQWTSFVAVSRKVVNDDPLSAIQNDVPLPMVDGVTEFAYPKKGRSAQLNPTPGKHRSGPSIVRPGLTKVASRFSGGSTPEPAALAGLVLIVLLMASGLLFMRQKSA